MSPELIILVGFIAVVAVVAALIGTLIGIRMMRRMTGGAPDRASVPAPPPAPKSAPAPEAAPEPAPPPANRDAPSAEAVALKAYQSILETKGIPAKDQDTQARDFAKQFGALLGKLDEISTQDTALDQLLDRARQALGSGSFGEAVSLLHQVGDQGGRNGRDLYRTATRYLEASASARVVAGDLEFAQMNFSEATRHYRAALDDLPPGVDDVQAEYLNKHGTAAYQSGNLLEATDSFEKAVKVLERTLGASHPDVATAINNLALLHYSRGDFAAAEPLYRRALEIDEQVLGPDHAGVATDLNNLALLYKKQGNLEAAEPLLKRALAIKERLFDPGHPSLVTGLRNYAAVLRALDRIAEAKTYEERAAALPPKRTG
jgi:tetratricopeptide (TPR) repeat protein